MAKQAVWQALEAEIAAQLALLHPVELIGLGLLLPWRRNGYLGRDPRTGAPVPIPPATFVTLRAISRSSGVTRSPLLLTGPELIGLVSMKLDVSPDEVSASLRARIRAAARGAARDGAALLGTLGLLSQVVRPERRGRNPATGQRFRIPARTTFTFQPSRSLRDILAGKPPAPRLAPEVGRGLLRRYRPAGLRSLSEVRAAFHRAGVAGPGLSPAALGALERALPRRLPSPLLGALRSLDPRRPEGFLVDPSAIRGARREHRALLSNQGLEDAVPFFRSGWKTWFFVPSATGSGKPPVFWVEHDALRLPGRRLTPAKWITAYALLRELEQQSQSGYLGAGDASRVLAFLRRLGWTENPPFDDLPV